ncbi:hypothetical protein LF1_53920 [Rubripirellula obstinata]|uniref:Uncharacterized protein n=1 Tax=Rubripirellula obstinata TaxID=406547 RepID=A0A5B1CCX9_9BACT|nr:hypothetical protein LF1_53920 [Rubripirellula obstinata]
MKRGDRAPSRITVCITEVAGFDVQAERKVCGRHSGACNGYPQHTIAMPSVSADFVHVGDNHQVQIVAKFRWSSKFRRAAVNRVFKDRRWLCHAVHPARRRCSSIAFQASVGAPQGSRHFGFV